MVRHLVGVVSLAGSYSARPLVSRDLLSRESIGVGGEGTAEVLDSPQEMVWPILGLLTLWSLQVIL